MPVAGWHTLTKNIRPMALLKIFKPKWQSSDTAVRLTAVRELTDADHALLLKIVEQDADLTVQLAALEKISDLHLKHMKKSDLAINAH